MSARENFLSLEGNLVADPELRYSASGMPVMTITVAYSDRVQVKGEWVDGPTSYFDVVCFGSMAEHVSDSFRKGHRVCVVGALKQRTWVDKSTGEKRYKIEINAEMVSASVRFGAVAVQPRSLVAAGQRPADLGADDEEPF